MLLRAGKRLYVRFIHAIRPLLSRLGLLRLLERYTHHRPGHWALSLFAIYDLDFMVKLDTPWLTYKTIDALKQHIAKNPNLRVFEYGSGSSTVWLAKRVKHLISVEHDPKWFAFVKSRLESFENAQLLLVPVDEPDEADTIYKSKKAGHFGLGFKRYASTIDDLGPFDLVIIDGRAREACLMHACRQLKPGGWIVFDNANRKSYQRAIKDSGLRVERHTGLAPALPHPNVTEILYKDT